MLFTSTLRTDIFYNAVFLMLLLLLVLYSPPVFSQENLSSSLNVDDALEEELRYLKAETYVITASRVPENIKKTASSVTVITDRQIGQMGARHLSDVIQTVPGMNYLYSHSDIYQMVWVITNT